MDFNEFLSQELANDEELRKEYEALESEYKLQEVMIRAAAKANITGKDIINVFNDGGLMAVYYLGLQHMIEYLEGEESETTV